jgi:hypothetical protein
MNAQSIFAIHVSGQTAGCGSMCLAPASVQPALKKCLDTAPKRKDVA